MSSMSSTDPDTTEVRGSIVRAAVRRAAWVATAAIALLAPPAAEASLFPPEVEDKIATFLAIFVIFLVPVVLIVLFWMVHVLPEKIAHKRHHPQLEAIKTLCLLSLVFGGLLWPLAWIWAFTKPVMYKMAYGTDTLAEGHAKEAETGDASQETAELRERLERLAGRGIPAAELGVLRADLDALEAKFAGGAH
jgi:CBS domain containing-hemolysin-like protein